MQIRIKSTKLELTEALKNYIQEKVDMLEKYLGGVSVINCDFEVERVANSHNKGDVFRAEINLQVPGALLRVEKSEEDMYKAIDKVKSHMELIIKKYKGKKQ